MFDGTTKITLCMRGCAAITPGSGRVRGRRFLAQKSHVSSKAAQGLACRWRNGLPDGNAVPDSRQPNVPRDVALLEIFPILFGAMAVRLGGGSATGQIWLLWAMRGIASM
jgi:hypothetical protein